MPLQPPKPMMQTLQFQSSQVIPTAPMLVRVERRELQSQMPADSGQGRLSITPCLILSQVRNFNMATCMYHHIFSQIKKKNDTTSMISYKPKQPIQSAIAQ